MAPEATSQRIRLLTALKKIEFVEVKSGVDREGERIIVDEASSERHKPGSVLKLLGSDRKTTQTLTKFLNALLEIVKCNGGMLECRGQDK
uniref:Uncharacterized protein n=1 Tax=Globisporangium ultimum (strain ATCC 200006 / CBS 805.95 / DAOM BR144) TaxID=431595 RepID=K3X9S9_GLOUD